MDYYGKYNKYKKKYLNLKQADQNKIDKPAIYLSSNNHPEKITDGFIENVLNSFFDFEWVLLGIEYTKCKNEWIVFRNNKIKNWWAKS